MTSIDDLRPHLLDNFQRQLLDASARGLLDEDNPLRLNHFSASFRELVRHVFDKLAPDVDVKLCSWFVPDPTSQTGVTRGHRASYVLHGGLSLDYATHTLGVDVEGERKALVKAVDKLSKFTHVNPSTFGLPSDEVTRYVDSACEALRDLLVSAQMARETLGSSLEAQIHNQVVMAAISETILSVDEIATHHSVDEVYVDQVKVIRVGSAFVEFMAVGSVGVELQWGSNSDVGRGDGAVGSESFPMTCQLESSVDDPENVSAVEDTLCVDTSSWYGEDDWQDDRREPPQL